MNSLEPNNFLAQNHPHARDSRIVFDEGPHVYTIDGSSADYISVTTFNKRNFDEFNADAIIAKMMSSKRWPQNKYFGQTVAEIKMGWDKNRDDAAAAGTKMHKDIESYYNQGNVINDSIEYIYFKQFCHEITAKNLKPYRTEWTIFHEDLKLAGSIDMVFEKTNGNLCIYDWKRCKEIVTVNSFQKYGKIECIKHLPDTNYWHYSLQLNTYKAILEIKYGKKVDEMWLVCLHPDNKNKNYQLFDVPNLQKEVHDLFEMRHHEISL